MRLLKAVRLLLRRHQKERSIMHGKNEKQHIERQKEENAVKNAERWKFSGVP